MAKNIFFQKKLIMLTSFLFTFLIGVVAFSQENAPPPVQFSPMPVQIPTPSPYEVQLPPGSVVPPPPPIAIPVNIPQGSAAIPPQGSGVIPSQPPPVIIPLVPGQQPSYQSHYNSSEGRKEPAEPLISEIITYDNKTAERPILVVKTSEGEFKIRLAPDINPITVFHFMGLADGSKPFIDANTSKETKRPFYTGLSCHRVVKGVLIQCGSPFGTVRGNPGVFVPDEHNPGLNFNKPGIVAMSLQLMTDQGTIKDAPNTAGSQFFISLKSLPEFNGKYAILGEITSGMDTIRKIASTPTGPTDRPIKRVVIFSVDPDVSTIPIIEPVAPEALPADPFLEAPGKSTLPKAEPGVDPFAVPTDD